MFDDITDEEYAEWKDWFHTGAHHLLFRIILLGIAVLGVCMVIQGFGPDQRFTNSTKPKAGAAPDLRQYESSHDRSDLDRCEDEFASSSVTEFSADR